MGQTMEGLPCPAFLGGCWEPVGVPGKPRDMGGVSLGYRWSHFLKPQCPHL